MKLLDLIFKTETKDKETLTDDLIINSKTNSKTKKVSNNKPIESEKITSLNYNNINVYSPKNQQEIEKIVINLQKSEASIINLKGYEKVTYIKILDFLNGAVFALNGNIARITQDLYLISPENLRIKVLR